MVQPDLPLPLRAALEASLGTGVSVLALVLTDEMTALAVTVLLAAIGGIVWLVRLEGQIKVQQALLRAHQESFDKLAEKVDRLVEHLNGAPGGRR